MPRFIGFTMEQAYYSKDSANCQEVLRKNIAVDEKSFPPKETKQKKKKLFSSFFQKPIDFLIFVWYNTPVPIQWPVGQAVKTLASHAENMGSIPVRVTNIKKECQKHSFLLL